MKVGRGGVRDRNESALLVDSVEVERGERVLAAGEVVANAEEVDYREQRDETNKRPGNRQDNGDAAAQRFTACDWRRGTIPRASQLRP